MADIIVDTYKLDAYAQRLKVVSLRINKLDRRLDTLYAKIGLLGLYQLIQANVLTVHNGRLTLCMDYLQQTADDFNKAEKELDYDRFVASQKPQSTLNLSLPSNPLYDIAIDKITEYINILNGEGDLRTKAQSAIAWLASIRSYISKGKDYTEWLYGNQVELPSPIKDGLDFIKALDTANKLIFGAADYADGAANGDVSLMVSGADNLLSAVKNAIAYCIKTDNMKVDFGASLLLDYGKNMVSNWLESIQTDTDVMSVYWKTFANSALEVFNDTVCNTTTLAIAYQPVKMVSSAIGIDIQGAYENLSDKTGFAAVTDSVTQLGDLIIENSTWENWTSGLAVIGESVMGWFD